MLDNIKNLITSLSNEEFRDLDSFMFTEKCKRKSDKTGESIIQQIKEKGLSIYHEDLILEGITFKEFNFPIKIYSDSKYTSNSKLDRKSSLLNIRYDPDFKPFFEEFEFINTKIISQCFENDNHKRVSDWDSTYSNIPLANAVVPVYLYYIPYTKDVKRGLGWNIDLNKLIFFNENKVYIHDSDSQLSRGDILIINNKKFIIDNNLTMNDIVLENIIPFRRN